MGGSDSAIRYMSNVAGWSMAHGLTYYAYKAINRGMTMIRAAKRDSPIRRQAVFNGESYEPMPEGWAQIGKKYSLDVSLALQLHKNWIRTTPEYSTDVEGLVH